jgi:hypothetical protein
LPGRGRAGLETTAATLAWAGARLVEHPAGLARLRGELRDRLGDAQVETAALERLPFLDAVLRETLHLAGSVGQRPRRGARRALSAAHSKRGMQPTLSSCDEVNQMRPWPIAMSFAAWGRAFSTKGRPS